MSDINPYNSTFAGEVFVGYDDVQTDLLAGLRDGGSYAILGGPYMGRTSIMLQLEQDLHTYPKAFAPHRALPQYIDIQDFDMLTPASLFETIYKTLVAQTPAPEWSTGESGQEYPAFLEHLEHARPLLDRLYGRDWVAVLLMDDLDLALFDLPDDQFFYDLGHLLTESSVKDHFRVVASGMKDMTALIAGNAPLACFQACPLRILSEDEVEELILIGFPDNIERKAKRRLIRLTGGHPYLLQGLLERLWQHEGEIDESVVKRAKKKFVKQQDFDLWLKYFGLLEHVIYQSLSTADEERFSMHTLHEGLPEAAVTKLEQALTVLGYHGVIDLRDPTEPQIAGTIFRDWYQSNSPAPDVTNALSAFQAAHEAAAALPVNEAVQADVQAALLEWLDEPPTAGEATPSVEKAIRTLKKARASAEPVERYIEQLQELDAYLSWAQ